MHFRAMEWTSNHTQQTFSHQPLQQVKLLYLVIALFKNFCITNCVSKKSLCHLHVHTLCSNKRILHYHITLLLSIFEIMLLLIIDGLISLLIFHYRRSNKVIGGDRLSKFRLKKRLFDLNLVSGGFGNFPLQSLPI